MTPDGTTQVNDPAVEKDVDVVGELEGTTLGLVGITVGMIVGTALGVIDGTALGPEGVVEGSIVGSTLGDIDGTTLGLVGITVGLIVGTALGEIDGEVVGEPEAGILIGSTAGVSSRSI